MFMVWNLGTIVGIQGVQPEFFHITVNANARRSARG
jgi:hypothetical protein